MGTYKEFKRHFVSLLGELQEVITYAEGNQRVFLRMTAATLEGAYRALLIFDGDVTPAVELLPAPPKQAKRPPKSPKPPKPEKAEMPRWGVEISSSKLLSALEAFNEMREKKKRPMTELARHQLYRNLISLSQNEETQIAILVQSIFNTWSGVFPLHSTPSKEPSRADKDAEAFEKDMVRRFMEGGA